MSDPGVPQPIRSGHFREGIAWKKSVLEKYVAVSDILALSLLTGREKSADPTSGNANEGIYIMSDVTEAYQKANAIIDDARAQYDKNVKQFRSEIKNDVSSIGASADKLRGELSRLASVFETVAKLMNDSDMQIAIANAERLVIAFNVLSEINGHKLTFAVMSGNKADT